MKKIKNTIMWCLTGFMILAGIVYFPSLTSTFMVLFAVISAPIKLWQEKISKIGILGWKKGVVLSILFFAAVLLTPTSEKNKDAVAQLSYSLAPVQTMDKIYSPILSPDVDLKDEQTQLPTEKPNPTAKQPTEIKPIQTPEQTPEQKPENIPEQVETPKPIANKNSNGKDRRSNWPNGSYLGSTESDKYHDCECRAAKNILSENEVWFSSEEAAKSAGYSRCGICW